ncbi:MAG: uncharacterized protein QOD06_1793 [Candidatus Binatota bacterium]|nr:uncharacterized protein [Candidatus Binatota bacterium]
MRTFASDVAEAAIGDFASPDVEPSPNTYLPTMILDDLLANARSARAESWRLTRTCSASRPRTSWHGYVQVIVEVRGTGSSEGTWDPFGTREQIDGKELVEWAAAQPWSNGSVALHGTSYGAINQLLTAAQQPKGLKALFPIVPMSDAYRDITTSGGEINVSFIPLWLGLVTSLGALPPTYAPSDPVGAAQTLAQHAGGVLAFQAPMVANSTAGGENIYDNPFYRTRSPIETIDRVTVPTFIAGGWYDLFQRGEPLLFQRLEKNGVPVKLVMGPWYHITAGDGLSADGVPSLANLERAWFDHWVCGVANGIESFPAVHYHEIGGGHYHAAPSWPPPGVSYQQRFLSGAARPGAAGDLANAPASSAQQPDVLPWHPAAGLCSRSTAQWTASGQPSTCANDNQTTDATGLAYDVVLDRDLHLAGPVSARLFVATSGKDAYLTVQLEDVDASGKSTELSGGWNLLSLRALDDGKSVTSGSLYVQPYHPFTHASVLPVEAGKIYEVWVEIFPTAARVAKGHSLRLSVQPSDSPHQTPSAPKLVDLAGGVLSLYHDAAHPSSVVLPVKPN